MSRIDVINGEKNKVKVLVNFGAVACFIYSSPAVANHEAQLLKENHYPSAELHLIPAN